MKRITSPDYGPQCRSTAQVEVIAATPRSNRVRLGQLEESLHKGKARFPCRPSARKYPSLAMLVRQFLVQGITKYICKQFLSEVTKGYEYI